MIVINYHKVDMLCVWYGHLELFIKNTVNVGNVFSEIEIINVMKNVITKF